MSVRILISGCGIAGPTLAFWARRHGIETTLVERAPELRTGGYVIDFWGSAFEVASRMGILEDLRRQAYVVKDVRMVDADGKRVGGFAADVFARFAGGRYFSIERGALAATIFRALPDDVETIFGDSISGLELFDDRVGVMFTRSKEREFDAVIGADGLHSLTRALAFGDESRFEYFLGYYVAAFDVTGYAHRDELVYVMYTDPGRQVSRFTLRDGRTMFLLVFRDSDPLLLPEGLDAQKELLRQRFASCGWETREILSKLSSVSSLYIDRVSQIRMHRWFDRRVGLVGDAAYCVSLLAGQGSALAMVGSFVLANELAASKEDPRAGFARYQSQLQGFLDAKQKAARKFASNFVPASRLGLAIRNRATSLLSIPLFARILVARSLTDSYELPPL